MSKVIIGMSGGVDSSVAAAILRDRGHEVVGVTLKLMEDNSPCEDAKIIADRLGIEHCVVDLKADFERLVVNLFIEEYVNGRTPNPCVVCNKHIKFGLLMDKMTELGADYIATGHYADVEQIDGRWRLKCAVDGKKDQSYVLYSLTQEKLSRILFPLSGITKEQARVYAHNLGLESADRPDSQEICFIPDNDYGSFIAQRRDDLPPEGDFVDSLGNVLGRHKGIINYTIGQRKGLGIALGVPVFVRYIDPVANKVELGDDPYGDEFFAADVNFIYIDMPKEPIRAQAKIRYAAKRTDCTIIPENGGVRVVFDVPQRAITPGQTVVFYDGDYVLGGGCIMG